MNIVGTCGTFDYILHPGHLFLLRMCKSLGEVVVFLVNDELVRQTKKREPAYSQWERRNSLLNTDLVSAVVMVWGTDMDSNIYQVERYGLTHYVFGPDQMTAFDSRLQSALFENGVYMLRSIQPETVHTTDILRRDGLLVGV